MCKIISWCLCKWVGIHCWPSFVEGEKHKAVHAWGGCVALCVVPCILYALVRGLT